MMPRNRPQQTGYARIAEAAETDSEDELDNSRTSLQSVSAPQFTSINPATQEGIVTDVNTSPQTNNKSSSRKRVRSNSSGVDIKAINARLEKWADEIASKFKINKAKGQNKDEKELEIHHSVFQPPEGVRPVTSSSPNPGDGDERMTKDEFDAIVDSVRVAIEQGIHPKMISQGSSGSYFARNSDGVVVGVFKPKDEEPYAAGNPKWNKWIHRNLFPCFFGRACLIPNLSYVSEAAAYTLDCRLQTNLVPYTGIVHISSKSFHYDFWHRRNFYRRKKPFPSKVGSFQVFLKGFKDANIFLRENPWPDHNGVYRSVDTNQKRAKPWNENAKTSSNGLDSEDQETEPFSNESSNGNFAWTERTKKTFREELEKLVILDYIMRNTDRGLDNWMIKVNQYDSKASISPGSPSIKSRNNREHISIPHKSQKPIPVGDKSTKPNTINSPKVTIGAIDNSLSWPWKHPDAWRSFPFGWLFLPVSLIGQPFSQKTRDHFLPLLTSKQWWSETQLELRKVFSQDVDFKERMFCRQIAVMKGQAWNVVETLKLADHGPLELTRRARVCVWDDLVKIPIAIPLRMPSAEMRRRHDQQLQEEMDISVANSSPSQPDLLGLASSPTRLPNSSRFVHSDSNPAEETYDVQSAPASSPNFSSELIWEPKSNRVKFSDRSAFKNSWTRMSYDGPSRPQNSKHKRERSLSFSSKPGDAIPPYDGDDLEGDLGYAVAEGMDGSHRKVIVERLETVKSKNPVFTWC
ncbi:LSB6/Type II phosphatidylinositol 4-kinase that binds Las17p [Blumeria hordei DH14]|uniref:Phosphatidylinositol 4-kinase n=1 Tax=Blumeria graminis f. sp. hordei (strain DH14) TaxID=546991 RepID=N1JGV3_BLUG1|nr:LSB6/Type II phosphatidylinositol 4-kinase that binds Las17p [Blumeria hordei DH14]